MLLAREEGIPVVMVFSAFQTNPQGLMFHLSNPVKDFPELNGRKVYVSRPGTYWQVIAAKYKLDKVQQFNYNGQLPIFLSDETNVSQCFVTLRAGHPQEPGQGGRLPAERRLRLQPVPERDGLSSRRRIKDNPELVQAYVTASLQGLGRLRQGPAPDARVHQVRLQQGEGPGHRDEGVRGREEPSSSPARTGSTRRRWACSRTQRFKELYAMMREYGVLKKDIDYKRPSTRASSRRRRRSLNLVDPG